MSKAANGFDLRSFHKGQRLYCAGFFKGFIWLEPDRRQAISDKSVDTFSGVVSTKGKDMCDDTGGTDWW